MKLRRLPILLFLALYVFTAHMHSAFAASSAAPDFFGVRALGSLPAGSAQADKVIPQWWTLLARHAADNGLSPDKSPMTAPVLRQWRTLLEQYPAMPPDKKLRTISGFFNRWPGKKDLDCYGQEEYWGTPAEFIRCGGGDCEDYAIAKYLALRMLNWPVQDMWVVLVDDTQRKAAHAVLIVRLGKILFVLDNLSRPKDLIMPQETYRTLYIPRCAFNETALWIYSYPKK